MNNGAVGDSGGESTFLEVFLNKHLLPVLVDDALAVSDEEGHDGEDKGGRGATEEDEDESCTGAVDDERGHCVVEEDVGENCTRVVGERDCKRSERRSRTGGGVTVEAGEDVLKVWQMGQGVIDVVDA